MNNLTPLQELYYLADRKSNLIAFLLALLPVSLSIWYTRGFLPWLLSLVALLAIAFTIFTTLVLLVNDVDMTEICTNFTALLCAFGYFIFSATDARRVNINLRKKLLGAQDAV